MAYCIQNRLLKIDLTRRKTESEPIEELIFDFLGGRGINQKILFDRVSPGIKAFDVDGVLAIGAGLLVGTLAPCACRLSIDSKSAFNDGIGSANMGGYFAVELKRAGFDHLFLAGRSEEPIYLWIHDREVEFRDASEIWSETTLKAEAHIRSELGDEDLHIIGIGPAGAGLARIACIIGDGARAAGRCGLGAVMGSKGVKAIAVKGTGRVQVAQPEAFRARTREYSEKLRKTAGAKSRGIFGTIPAVKAFNAWSATPFRNFQDEYVEEDRIAKLAPEAFEKYSEKRLGCAFCPIGCQHVYRISEGPYEGLVCNKLEANTVWNFGTKLDITYPPAIIAAQQRCCEYGLDIDGASSVIAWAMECFEREILTTSDTDGLELRWGDHAVVMELLGRIARREGFGKVLGDGVQRASQEVGKGSEKFAVHIKGQDLIEPMRSLKAWALGIAVSPRGAAHTRGAAGSITRLVPPEKARSMWGLDPETAGDPYAAAPAIVKYYEQFHAVLDSLGLCFFSSNWLGPDALSPEDVASIVSAALGKNVNAASLMAAGERIHNVEKAFNVRHAGFSRKHDYPPERLMREAVKSGPGRGEILKKEGWERMLEGYYLEHGWNQETGWPTRESLAQLSLQDVADVLEEEGRLGD
jgi:aldehyde:ferredoxin oxidoreductase